ncbi:hypothetical protein BBJ28_00026010 [Nothophytophthora sp. Chile5]|nr:hypothetical protein BBJ28_00026010 [Nothophytophthora sp. Chile5]
MDAGKLLKPAGSGLGAGPTLSAASMSSSSLLSSHNSSSNVLLADDSTAAKSSAAAPVASSSGVAAASSSAAAPSSAVPTASNGETESVTAAAAPVTPASLLEGIKAQKEWAKTIVFDGDGNLVVSTVKPLDGEMECVALLVHGGNSMECVGLLKLFNKREDTMASGILLLNEQYDVHRFHPPLIYGRRGDPSLEEGEGIAVCKVAQSSNPKRALFCLITYVYPTLSARAVPQLKEFCETQRELTVVLRECRNNVYLRLLCCCAL